MSTVTYSCIKLLIFLLGYAIHFNANMFYTGEPVTKNQIYTSGGHDRLRIRELSTTSIYPPAGMFLI